MRVTYKWCLAYPSSKEAWHLGDVGFEHHNFKSISVDRQFFLYFFLIFLFGLACWTWAPSIVSIYLYIYIAVSLCVCMYEFDLLDPFQIPRRYIRPIPALTAGQVAVKLRSCKKTLNGQRRYVSVTCNPMLWQFSHPTLWHIQHHYFHLCLVNSLEERNSYGHSKEKYPAILRRSVKYIVYETFLKSLRWLLAHLH